MKSCKVPYMTFQINDPLHFLSFLLLHATHTMKRYAFCLGQGSTRFTSKHTRLHSARHIISGFKLVSHFAFRSDVEDGEIRLSKEEKRRRQSNSDRSATSSKNRDAPVRSNGFGDAKKSRSMSQSNDDDYETQKRNKKSKKRQSDSGGGGKRRDRFVSESDMTRMFSNSKRRSDSDDDLLTSPRASMPSRIKRRGELPRYDVRNIILKKRESRNKKKGSLSRSRSR